MIRMAKSVIRFVYNFGSSLELILCCRSGYCDRLHPLGYALAFGMMMLQEQYDDAMFDSVAVT